MAALKHHDCPLSLESFTNANRNVLLDAEGYCLQCKVLNKSVLAAGHPSERAQQAAAAAPQQAEDEVRLEKIRRIKEWLLQKRVRVEDRQVKEILEIIFMDNRYFAIAQQGAEEAHDLFVLLRDQPRTGTKSCIANGLGMKINGSISSSFPFILGAHDSEDNPKVIKILAVHVVAHDRSMSVNEVKDEAKYAAMFRHPRIVPMEYQEIEIDLELANNAKCNAGLNKVLIMPWYMSNLSQHPSNCLNWVGTEGTELLKAIKYLHTYDDGTEKGYVHMDIKSDNVFVDHDNHWFLGDFGSCKKLGDDITSLTAKCYHKKAMGQPATFEHDFFMFLVMVLIECLEDRRRYVDMMDYTSDLAIKCMSKEKVVNAAQVRISAHATPQNLKDLLIELLQGLEAGSEEGAAASTE